MAADRQSGRSHRRRLAGLTRRLGRWILRCVKCVVLLIVGYASGILIGMVPINRAFRNTPDGIEIYVRGDAVHTEFIVPARNDVVDWNRCFPPHHFQTRNEHTDYYGISWGDRDFFIETPTWADARFPTIAKAMLWPTSTVMHVRHADRPPDDAEYQRVVLSAEQYRRLCSMMLASFRDRPDDLTAITGAHYGEYDAFYHARGKYHLFNTCNNWTGRTLRRTGVRSGIWTPFAPALMWQLRQAQ